MRARVAILLLAVPALAGCTRATNPADGFSGEEERVAQVVADLSDNAARGKHAETCDQLFSAALREKVAGAEKCSTELRKAFEDADGSVIDVDDVTISGTSAKAIVSSDDRGETVKRTFDLIKENGRWRLESFG